MSSGRILKYSSNAPTQGMLFPCVRVPGYECCPAWGIFLTARCDFVQKKAPIFNYAPVVRIEDWLCREGSRILTDRLRADQLLALEQFIASNGYSSAIVKAEPPARILDVLFPSSADDRKTVNARKRGQKIVRSLALIRAAACSGPDSPSHNRVQREFKKHFGALLRDVLSHGLAGYHFLEEIQYEERSESGYVVLLRHVYFVPANFATSMCRGIDHASFQAYRANHPVVGQHFEVGTEEYLAPGGILRSPDIEHLMQRFGALFTRVGVADIEPSYARGLPKRLLAPGGGEEQ